MSKEKSAEHKLSGWKGEDDADKESLLGTSTFLMSTEELEKKKETYEFVDPDGNVVENVLCPRCGSESDAISGLADRKEMPKDGETRVCLECGYLTQFEVETDPVTGKDKIWTHEFSADELQDYLADPIGLLYLATAHVQRMNFWFTILAGNTIYKDGEMLTTEDANPETTAQLANVNKQLRKNSLVAGYTDPRVFRSELIEAVKISMQTLIDAERELRGIVAKLQMPDDREVWPDEDDENTVG